MTIINLKRLNNLAEIPSKQYLGDAAFDVVATSINITTDYIEYGLGFTSEMPENIKGVIVPRSSLSKKDLLMCNSPAQIDNGYDGEWKVRFKYIGKKIIPISKDKNINELILDEYNVYKVGDRIAQIYFEEINPTHVNLHNENGDIETKFQGVRERGEGGFGSSDGGFGSSDIVS